MAAPSNLDIRYVFSLEANVDATPVGETPTGYRVDIQYLPPGKVFTDPLRYFDDWVAPQVAKITPNLNDPSVKGLKGANDKEKGQIVDAIVAYRQSLSVQPPQQPPPALLSALPWYGFDGELLSGSDWAIIGSDGVANFTGLVTLRSTDADQGLLALTLEGPVDLLSLIVQGVPASPSQGFQSVLSAAQSGALQKAPMVIAASFDAAGDAEPWAPKRMRRQADGFWKYRPLTRSQFIALGNASFSKSPDSPIVGVQVDFYRLVAT
jgi:hypothetical protein